MFRNGITLVWHGTASLQRIEWNIKWLLLDYISIEQFQSLGHTISVRSTRHSMYICLQYRHKMQQQKTELTNSLFDKGNVTIVYTVSFLLLLLYSLLLLLLLRSYNSWRMYIKDRSWVVGHMNGSIYTMNKMANYWIMPFEHSDILLWHCYYYYYWNILVEMYI